MLAFLTQQCIAIVGAFFTAGGFFLIDMYYYGWAFSNFHTSDIYPTVFTLSIVCTCLIFVILFIWHRSRRVALLIIAAGILLSSFAADWRAGYYLSHIDEQANCPRQSHLPRSTLC